MPKGGGALKGIDEKFEVNTANGTAGFSPMASYEVEEDILGQWCIQVNHADLPDDLKIDQQEQVAMDSNKIEDIYLVLKYMVDL